MTQQIDWQGLRNLRKLYISGNDSIRDYWTNSHLLHSYDLTLGQRISWKWQAVLRRLLDIYKPSGRYSLLDWGCGTGVAARTWTELMGVADQYRLADRSPKATKFAKEKLLTYTDSSRIEQHTVGPSLDENEATADVLLLSHVVTELSDEQFSALVDSVTRFTSLVWVDAGTQRVSQRMVDARSRLLAAGFEVLDPCLHQDRCGLESADRANDWCHFFADPPSEAFHSAFWQEVKRELEIDLNTLPCSYLVMQKIDGGPLVSQQAPQEVGEKARVIGRVRKYKGFCKAQLCRPGKLADARLQKRDYKKEFKDLSTTKFDQFWPVDDDL